MVDAPTARAAPIRLPAARTLAERLPLTRALRPFRQTYPSKQSVELDEEATAELTAELRSAGLTGVFPVQRSSRERWFNVHLVLEDDPAAALWEAPLEEFARVLAQSGAFRMVQTWRLELDPATPQDSRRAALAPLRRGVVDPRNRQERSVQTRISGDPRELIFFASHGASAHWLDGSYARLLLGWSSAAVTLLHLLPRDRHAQTVLGEPHGDCLAPQPGSSAAALRAEVMWWRTDAVPGSPGVVQLPMTTLDPPALGNWALAEMARGRRVPIYLLDADDPVDVRTKRPAELTDLEVQQRLAVIRERSSAAYELAIALSAGPFTLPVARVVQEVLFGSATDTTLLADLMLSGIVAMDEYKGVGDAAFRAADRAKTALARASRREDRIRLVEDLQRRVGQKLGEKAAQDLSFAALLLDSDGREQLPTSITPFASFVRPIAQGLAPRAPPALDVERLLKRLAPSRVGELYRLSVRKEALTDSSVRPDLWRWLRDENLVTFEAVAWSLRPELVTALARATREDPIYGLRVLWVDDRPDNNVVFKLELMTRDVSVVTEASTVSAMSRSDLDAYDVIISDMSRPPDSKAGFALIAALRESGFQTPVVIYAGGFASSSRNRTRVREAGGFGCTNEAHELLQYIIDAAQVLLRIPAVKNEQIAPSLDTVRASLLAQIAARHRAAVPLALEAAALGVERQRLIALVRHRSFISEQPSSARPPGSTTQAGSGAEQWSQQREQQRQSQEYTPPARNAAIRLFADPGVAAATRDVVVDHLRLLMLAADAEVAEPSLTSSFPSTGSAFSPRSWQEALGRVPENLGWNVTQLFNVRGSFEGQKVGTVLRQSLGEVVSDSRDATGLVGIVNDWLEMAERASAEMSKSLKSSADYAAAGLHLRLAVLISERDQGEARLLLFSSFITRIAVRNVFLLRLATKVEGDSVVMSLTMTERELTELAPAVNERLATVAPSLLPVVEVNLLRPGVRSAPTRGRSEPPA